jgi:hypothetical protein
MQLDLQNKAPDQREGALSPMAERILSRLKKYPNSIASVRDLSASESVGQTGDWLKWGKFKLATHQCCRSLERKKLITMWPRNGEMMVAPRRSNSDGEL